MKCHNCGAVVQDSDRFCEQCGSKLEVVQGQMEKENSDQVVRSQENYNGNQQGNASVASTDYVNVAKQMGTGYISFFKNVFKNPYGAAKSVNESNFASAIISIVLLSLIIPLIIYSVIKDFISMLLKLPGASLEELYYTINKHDPVGVVTPGDVLPIISFIVKPFLFIIILQAIVIGIIFLFVKNKHPENTIKDVVARYGTFITSLLVLFAVSLLTVFVSYKISLFLLSIGLTCMLFVFPLILSIYHDKNRNSIDPLIGSFIIYIVFITAEYFYIQSIFKALIMSLLGDASGPFEFFSKFIGF
jgi:hypothetical protein